MMMSSKRSRQSLVSWLQVVGHKSNNLHEAEEERRWSSPDYYNGTLLRVCLCPNPNCKSLVKRWIDLGDNKRCGYHMLPAVPKKQETHRGCAIVAYLKVVYRHIFGNGTRIPERQNNKTRYYLAYHHFDSTILLPDNGGPMPIVDSSTATKLGFMESDRLPAESVAEKGFFAAPSYRLKEVEADLRIAERLAGINQNDTLANPAARKPPAERELEQLIRQFSLNPRETASAFLVARAEVQEQRDLIQKLEAEKNQLAQQNEALQQELESTAEVFINSGISRSSFTSDSWHTEHPNAANFLFGWKNWKSTKSWLKLMFKDMEQKCKPNGVLTDFESVLAVMMCWRVPMKQELAALILDVDRSVISRRVEKWAPVLGRKGKLLSNLDLQSNFDFLSLERCNAEDVEHYDNALTRDPFKSYIDAQMPRVFFKDDLADISLLVDGKDILTDSVRVNSGVNILMYSPKSQASAARVLSWILAGGLNVYNTGLYLGRVSEERLVELHGEIDSNNIRLPPN